MSSRALLWGAFIVVIAIVIAYLLLRTSETNLGSSYPGGETTTTSPAPSPMDTMPGEGPPPSPEPGPIDPNDTGGAAHGATPKPPQ